jgi:drug/metabolite transporter (DMT)-like permease
MRLSKGYFYILGATIFWGVSATIAKSLFERHFDALILVQMRITISCILLLGFFLVFRPRLLVVTPRDLLKFSLLGILGIAGSNFAYYYTIQETNVATAILLQYMAPVLVLMYAALSATEKLTLTKVLAALASLLGCTLALFGKNIANLTARSSSAFLGGAGLPSITWAGLAMGVLSAFCWAFTNISLRRILREYTVWTALAYTFIFASLFWLVINPPWAILAAGYSAHDWWIFFLIAVASILIPHSLYYTGVRYLTPTRAIITASFEPVVAIISAFLFLGETLNHVQILGSGIVIGAIVLLQMNNQNRQEE